MPESIDQIIEDVESGRFREAGQRIEQLVAEQPEQLASPRHTNFANWLILAANWRLITRLVNPGTNFFLESGWLESLLREKPVDKAGAPIPWYTYPAIDFIEARIGRRLRVFEYGSGG